MLNLSAKPIFFENALREVNGSQLPTQQKYSKIDKHLEYSEWKTYLCEDI